MITQSDLPSELRQRQAILPTAYARVFELGLTNILPWQFLDGAACRSIYDELRLQYPAHHFLPFARRLDDDDVACVIVSSADHPVGAVVNVHLYSSPDLAVDQVFASSWDWYRAAVEIMIAAS